MLNRKSVSEPRGSLSRGGGKGGEEPLAPQALQGLQGLFFRLKPVDRRPVPGFDVRHLARGDPDGSVQLKRPKRPKAYFTRSTTRSGSTSLRSDSSM